MRILALVESADHVCCRYRIEAFRPALYAAGCALHVEPIPANPLARCALFQRAARFDVTLLQRKLLPGWQLEFLRQHARRLVFDYDDAVRYRDSYDPRGPYCPRRARRFGALMRQVDQVLAGNAFLAQMALDSGAVARRVHIIPTCIDHTLYAPKQPSAPTQKTCDLVWVGSSSTLRGLEQNAPLLQSLGASIDNISLTMICDRFARLDPLRVRRVTWSRETEATTLAQADVGISWIPDDLWSLGKCGLKLLQYMAAGLPVVANPVGVHTEIVRAGETGFLPRTPSEWIEAVRALAANPDLRAELGTAGRLDLERTYSVAAWSGRFVSALLGQSGVPPQPHAALRPEPVAVAPGATHR